MVVEYKKEKLNSSFLYNLQKKIEYLEFLPFKDLSLDIYHCPREADAKHNNKSGMFFTDNSSYFSGRFEILYKQQKVGTFTLSCFPNCCGMCIITANYGVFRIGEFDKIQEFTLLLACYIAKGNYRSVTAIDNRKGKNYTTYLQYGWKEIHNFYGNGNTDLGQVTLELDDTDFLGEIKKLYGEEIKKAKEERTNA